MKKIRTLNKILLSGICILFLGCTITAYAAEEFSFDLDQAIKDATGEDAAPNADENASKTTTKSIFPSVDAKSYLDSSNAIYYDPALIKSLVEKYKEGNYVGCIQEAQSKMRSESPNPVAMYYMALSYTQIGDVNAALEIYDEILKLKPSDTLRECTIRGRDCLIGGPACPSLGVDGADIDAQVQEYKQGSSKYRNEKPADVPVPLSGILTKDELATLPDTVYPGETSFDDANKKVVDHYIAKKQEQIEETIKNAPDSQDVASAIKTLQDAGIAVTVNAQPVGAMNANYNNDIAQMTALLGSNSSQNRGFDMMPYMMMQAQNNPQQYNPQMFQAMMMNYMMPSMDFSSGNKD